MMTVESDALSLAVLSSPPPATEAKFKSGVDALAATSTVSVTGG
jgi:hypothetical protein